MKTLYLTLMLFLQVLLASFILYAGLSQALPVEQKEPSGSQIGERKSEVMLCPSEEEHLAEAPHKDRVRGAGGCKVAPSAAKSQPDSPVVVNSKGHSKSAPVKGLHQQQQSGRKEELKSPAQRIAQQQQQQQQSEIVAKKEPAPQVYADMEKKLAAEAAEAPAAKADKPEEAAVVKKRLEKQQRSSQLAEPEAAAAPKQDQPKAAEPAEEAMRSKSAATDEQPKLYIEKKLAAEPVPAKLEEPAKKLEERQMVNQPYNPNGGYGGGYGGGQPAVVVAPSGSGLVPGQQVTVISTGVVAPAGGYQPYQPPYRPYKEASAEEKSAVERQSATRAPVVKGGLGPLHLLAATLCSYQADKPVSDENLSLLYSRRAALRKSLFDFMSLKFTNLERFSSRLNSGVALEVVPPKIAEDPSQAAAGSPTHGWPVVGKCTAHDLKLMAEAAWCECESGEAGCSNYKPAEPQPADEQPPKITSNHHVRVAREAAQPQAQLQENPADKSAIISKLLHVADVKEAPVVESAIASLNLTQQQLAAVQAKVAAVDSNRECRKSALRMTKALFNHLAEDQRLESESWPKLHAQMASDECARKRMIDIVSALSGYRTEATTIRRDNVEFAFAMDDLRTKVLESDVNVPLTFDKQFIEVGQFLQQSVKLMLTNIDPDRAKLTSMRYRSLMPGPVSADDQCIELHQRLLAKNYPTDCNPTQFGQLPDVLRMAASSLELWSIESELAKYNSGPAAGAVAQRSGSPKQLVDQTQASAAPQSYSEARQEVNECIANLVSY